MSEGFDTYRVLVTSVENTSYGRVAVTQDQFGNMRSISAQVLTGGGTIPQAGEVWEVDRTSGGWVFARLVKSVRPVLTGSIETGSTLLSLVSSLSQVGLVDDQTTQIPAGTGASNYPPGATDKEYLYWNVNHADWTPGDPHQVYVPTPGDPTTLTLVMSGNNQRLTSRIIGEIIPWPSNTMPDSTWLLLNGQAVSRTLYSTLYGLTGTTFGAGDGSTTFNLPNLTGRFPLGVSGTTYPLAATGGEASHVLTVGELAAHAHTLTDPGHNHTVNNATVASSGHRHNFKIAQGMFWGARVGDSWGAGEGAYRYSTGVFGGDGGITSTSTAQINSGVTTTLVTPGGAFNIRQSIGDTDVPSATSVVSNNSATTGITMANAGSGTAHNNMPPYVALNWIIKAAYTPDESFTPGVQGLVSGSDLNQFQIAGNWSATSTIAATLVHVPYTAMAGVLAVVVSADGTMITQTWTTSGNFAYRRVYSASAWGPWEGTDNPLGTPVPCLVSTPSPGYLLADGSTASRTTYAALFAKIGTTFGAGDGSTTFGLPNLKGLTIVGMDGTQTEFNALGKTGGEKTHTLTLAESPTHNHGVTDPGHTHIQDAHGHGLTNGSLNLVGDGTSGANWASAAGTAYGFHSTQITSTAATNQTATTGITTQNAGSGGGHNNLQPYMALPYAIRF